MPKLAGGPQIRGNEKAGQTKTARPKSQSTPFLLTDQNANFFQDFQIRLEILVVRFSQLALTI